MGMGKNTIPRESAVKSRERLLESVDCLEEFAVAFPESRAEVIDLIGQYSGEEAENGKSLKEISERISAMGMLEILSGV
ncbi:MAG: hypothetical protein ACYCO0_05130 [Candidatus Micrarchaeaceae archaeon]